MKALFLTVLILSGCTTSNATRFDIRSQPLENEGFRLVSLYQAYEARALHLLRNNRLKEGQKAPLRTARETAAPFMQPTAEAATELYETVNAQHVDHAQRIVLENNMRFWIHHFRPHVEVLINTVRGTHFNVR